MKRSASNHYHLSPDELKLKRIWDKLHALKRIELLIGPGRMDYDDAIQEQYSTFNGLPETTKSYIYEYMELKRTRKKRYY